MRKLKIKVNTRYGNYLVEADDEEPEVYGEENTAIIKTPGGKVMFYGWTLIAPETAFAYLEDLQPEEVEEPRMIDYRQVAPDEAAELIQQGYIYTGERWRGLVGVAKYQEANEMEEKEVREEYDENK